MLEHGLNDLDDAGVGEDAAVDVLRELPELGNERGAIERLAAVLVQQLDRSEYPIDEVGCGVPTQVDVQGGLGAQRAVRVERVVVDLEADLERVGLGNGLPPDDADDVGAGRKSIRADGEEQRLRHGDPSFPGLADDRPVATPRWALATRCPSISRCLAGRERDKRFRPPPPTGRCSSGRARAPRARCARQFRP